MSSLTVLNQQLVRLRDGGRGLYVTLGVPGQPAQRALSCRLRRQETAEQALQRALRAGG
ncbi:MAG: hypothetical protein ACREVL_01455 [Solimonas sp.]